jgi:hypothetical protein
MRPKFPSLNISFLLFLVVLTPALVVAQVNEKEKAQKELEKRQELERKTLSLLDEVASASWGLKLAENRSFIQATVADLLWPHDEKRARSLFWEALNGFGLTTNAAFDDPATKGAANESTAKGASAKNQNDDKARNQKRYYEIYAARRELLMKVARRDPQLALDMLRASRPAPLAQDGGKFEVPDETELENWIATEAAERDPKKALQIAREVLAKGLKFELLHLVQRLNKHNQEMATEFAGDIIGKLQTANLTADLDTWQLADTLLIISRVPNVQQAADLSPQLSWIHIKLSDDQKRKLVELLTDAAMSLTTSPNLLNNLHEIMPEIEQFAPDRVPKLKARMAQSARTLNRNQQDWNTYNDLFRNGTPEEMIQAGVTVGERPRHALYSQAIVLAVLRDRANGLREYINSKVEDESRRRSLLDALDAEQISAAVHRGKIEELRKLLSVIRIKEQRARAMAELAILLEKKGQHDEALELLGEAQALVKVDLMSETQSHALLTLLLAYALVDPAKAFGIVEPIIDRANDNISKLLLLDKIAKSGNVKSGEIVLSQSGVPLDVAIMKYGPGVVALAKADFNRTRGLADRFQRNELRLFTRLLLAHSILSSLESPDRAQPPRTLTPIVNVEMGSFL